MPEITQLGDERSGFLAYADSKPSALKSFGHPSPTNFQALPQHSGRHLEHLLPHA